MSTSLDGVLVQWGDRLFYPANRNRVSRTPALTGLAVQQRAQALRQRIRATVVRRAPQVMVKVTGGGRGMGAIAAHLRYIPKGGRLPFEDDRGVVRRSAAMVGRRCTPSSINGAWAAAASRRRASAGKPSTSCCRCRAAPTSGCSSRLCASSPRPNWPTTAT